ncbi:hypothetical protein AB0O67_24390 [Streptomyces sp. NPDC086077]|uniref:DUF6907 domain-containing protein n=1 Tax=Streptomyces sp. NPDC086077 TaxID=3154862 RepID=UPI0034303A18
MNDRIVSLKTLDSGTVTVREPVWCLGHEGDPVVHLADVTHNGEWTSATVDTARGPVEFLRARLSWAPFGELQPEPYPVVEVVDVGDLNPEQLRALAAEAAVHAGRLYSLANQLDRLWRYGR